MTYTFFFAAIEHSRLEEVHTLIYKYVDASAACIIGLEKADGVHQLTNGEHMHFAVDMTEDQWKLFYKTFVNRFNLGGKNSKDKSYYGRIKPDKVKDETKFLSYTVKDNNYWTKNVELKDIHKYLAGSYQKQTKKSLDEEVNQYIHDAVWNISYQDIRRDPEKHIGLAIIQYYRDNPSKGMPNKHFIKRHVLKFMMQNNQLFSNETIFNFIYN